jgi:hypothetical protein
MARLRAKPGLAPSAVLTRSALADTVSGVAEDAGEAILNADLAVRLRPSDLSEEWALGELCHLYVVLKENRDWNGALSVWDRISEIKSWKKHRRPADRAPTDGIPMTDLLDELLARRERPAALD